MSHRVTSRLPRNYLYLLISLAGEFKSTFGPSVSPDQLGRPDPEQIGDQQAEDTGLMIR